MGRSNPSVSSSRFLGGRGEKKGKVQLSVDARIRGSAAGYRPRAHSEGVRSRGCVYLWAWFRIKSTVSSTSIHTLLLPPTPSSTWAMLQRLQIPVFLVPAASILDSVVWYRRSRIKCSSLHDFVWEQNTCRCKPTCNDAPNYQKPTKQGMHVRRCSLRGSEQGVLSGCFSRRDSYVTVEQEV